jgi:hypothetical protein
MSMMEGPFVLMKIIIPVIDHPPYEVYVLPELDKRTRVMLEMIDGISDDNVHRYLGNEDVHQFIRGEAFVELACHLDYYTDGALGSMDVEESFRDRCRNVRGKWLGYKQPSLAQVNAEHGGSIKGIFTIDFADG